MDANNKRVKILKWMKFNTEIIEFGSVKYKVKLLKTLNEATLNISSSVLYVDKIYLPAIF
jgi:hypothetical protein